MRIAVTGSSGLVGSALAASLTADGHEVVRLVRRPPARPGEVRWDVATGEVEEGALAGVDGVVHLAGAGVGDRRWTAAYKREIRDSRVLGTAGLARTLAALPKPPRVLLSGSAIGFYGDTGDRAVDESDPAGEGFLPGVCREWEAATAPAGAAGIRVVHLRTGLVVASSGGAWGRMFPLFRFGLGGRLGSGRQYWSFVSLADMVAALRFLLEHEVSGPVNVTAPRPVTNAEVTRAMGRVLGRPAVAHVPAFALRFALGEFSVEVLSSRRVLPAALVNAGFAFAHPDIEDAVRAAAGRER